MKAPQYCPYAGIHTVRPESGEMFAGRKITQDEKFWEYLNQYDVICLKYEAVFV